MAATFIPDLNFQQHLSSLSVAQHANFQDDDAWDDIELPDDGLGNDMLAESPPNDTLDSLNIDEQPSAMDDIDIGGFHERPYAMDDIDMSGFDDDDDGPPAPIQNSYVVPTPIVPVQQMSRNTNAEQPLAMDDIDLIAFDDDAGPPAPTHRSNMLPTPVQNINANIKAEDAEDFNDFLEHSNSSKLVLNPAIRPSMAPLVDVSTPTGFAGTVQRYSPRKNSIDQSLKSQRHIIQAWQDDVQQCIRSNSIAASHPDFEGPLSTMAIIQRTNTDTSIATTTAAPEALDSDFEFLDDNIVLKLADRNLHKASEPAPADMEIMSDGWSDSQSVHRDALSRRFLAPSPTPSSSAASMVASESEEETFDDLEFPDTVEALRLGTYKANQPGVEPEGDDGDDIFAGLLIPDDSSLHPERLKAPVIDLTPTTPTTPTIPTTSPSARSGSPSKIPRAVPVRQPSMPSPSTDAGITLPSGRPNLRINTGLDTLNRSDNSKPVLISPSVGHIQRLSSQLISNRRIGNDNGNGPTKMLRKPKGNVAFGDGTELDAFDDLPVSTDTESKFVKKTKPVPKVALESPSRAAPQKRTFSKSGSTSSRLSFDDRENRGLYSNTAPVNHRPMTNYGDRRPPTSSHKKRPRKKPTLIRNLNNNNTVKVVGEMTYNPTLQKWEGNEDVLLEFDRASPSRPALITNKGGYKMPQVVGGMVFDPTRMCWVGNEEEADVFADFPDDMSVITDVAPPSTKEQTEFDLPRSVKEAMCIAESSHKLFMGKWYPKAILDSRTMIRDTSKTHLYEIRTQTKTERRPKYLGRGPLWR